MYEQECDLILAEIVEKKKSGIMQHKINSLHQSLTTKGITCDKTSLQNAASILYANKHIRLEVDYISSVPDDVNFHLTHAGFEFISTTSYKDTKVQKELHHKKTQQEVRINEWLIKTKWLPLLLSILSVIISIIALAAKN